MAVQEGVKGLWLRFASAGEQNNHVCLTILSVVQLCIGPDTHDAMLHDAKRETAARPPFESEDPRPAWQCVLDENVLSD